MTRSGSWLALPLLVACGSSPPSDSPQPTSGGAESTTGDTSTGLVPSGPDPSATPCELSEDCEDTGVCAAAYDAGLQQPGPAYCVEGCIGPGDLTRWCVDDTSCCDGARCSEVDGFCVPPDAATTGSSTGGSGSSGGGSGSSGSGSTAGSDTTTSSEAATDGATGR